MQRSGAIAKHVRRLLAVYEYINILQEYIIAYTYARTMLYFEFVFYSDFRDLLRCNTKRFNKYHCSSIMYNPSENYNTSNCNNNTLSDNNITQGIEFHPIDRINEMKKATNIKQKEIGVDNVCDVHCHGDDDDIEIT